MKRNAVITILTYAVAFMVGDGICNILGLNNGGVLSINTLLSIIILAICVLVFELLVSKIRILFGKK